LGTAQPGIFALGTRTHRHLELDVRSDARPEEVRRAIAALREPAVTSGGVNLVIGLGPDLLRRIAPDDVPEQLRSFPDIAGTVHTPHDLWVWIHGTGSDVDLDSARAVTACLGEVARLASDVPGFVYHDGRDLTGFIDGTENPPAHEAPEVALIPVGDTGAGGSFALVQRWVHDLASFHRLSITDQEDVFGRTKADSIELDDDVKPPTAHIARVVIEEDGEELEIFRRSVPYGTVAEHGLVFVAFSAESRRFELMLERMFGRDDGLHDRLTEFSRPVSGAYYFVPSIEALQHLS
jgi:porphyrinogen peroxidase